MNGYTSPFPLGGPSSFLFKLTFGTVGREYPRPCVLATDEAAIESSSRRIELYYRKVSSWEIFITDRKVTHLCRTKRFLSFLPHGCALHPVDRRKVRYLCQSFVMLLLHSSDLLLFVHFSGCSFVVCVFVTTNIRRVKVTVVARHIIRVEDFIWELAIVLLFVGLLCLAARVTDLNSQLYWIEDNIVLKIDDAPLPDERTCDFYYDISHSWIPGLDPLWSYDSFSTRWKSSLRTVCSRKRWIRVLQTCIYPSHPITHLNINNAEVWKEYLPWNLLLPVVQHAW